MHLTTSMTVIERCSLFGEMRRCMSLLAPVLKQSFCNNVWMEQRTKTKTTVPKTCNSHVGGVDHNRLCGREVCYWCKGKCGPGHYLHGWWIMALVNAWLLYRHVDGTDTLDLLYFKHAVAVPSHAMPLPKACGMTFCHHLLVKPEPCLILRFHGMGHIVAK